jgi:aspartate/methionine/tyrosine aminotransferase
MSALKSVVSETFSAVSAPIQYAAVKAYADFEEVRPFVEKTRDIYKYVMNYLRERFIEIGLNCPKPGGSFYLFPDFENFKNDLKKKGIITSSSLVNTLLNENRIAVLPGSDFYMPSTSLSVRVAGVDFDGANALERWPGINNVDDIFLEDNFPKILQGCKCISQFLSELS